MLSVLLGVTAVLSGCASGTDSVGAALKARYRQSLVEINDPRTQGRIVSPGVILILQSEGVSAKRFRVIQANKTPRFHARDYAQVEIAPDGRLTAAPGDFTLTKGTRLAVLDLKVEKDRLRLFAHTLASVGLADSRAVYGCTEFVFHFDAGTLERSDVATVQGRVEAFLTLVPDTGWAP